MSERERSESGQFVETVTLEGVLDVFDRVRGPVITSSDVADALDCTTEAARQKLTRLYDRGEVDKRKTGRTVVYWRTGDDDAERERERAETPSAGQPDQTPAPTGGTRDAPQADGERDSHTESDALADDVRAHLEATDQPPKTAHGRGVILDVFQLLRERGPMKTGDLQDEIYPDYADHWSDGRTMWNAIDRYLEDVPGIEKGGYGEWAYAGDDAVRAALADAPERR